MEKVEIRSEKVRNLIGIIPPKLIRYGIYIIVSIVVILCFMACYIPFDFPVEVKVKLWNKGKKLSGIVSVPVGQDDFIDKQRGVRLDLKGFKNMHNMVLVMKFDTTSALLTFSEGGNKVYTISSEDQIIVSDTLVVPAEVFSQQQTLWERIKGK